MFKENDRKILEKFLRYPIDSDDAIFKKFKKLENAVYREGGASKKERFVYIPGTREDRVLLTAHADTVWDAVYRGKIYEQDVVREENFYKGVNPGFGFGADDRAGCAMLWLLRNSGHSLLITDGAQYGQIGSTFLMGGNSDIYEEINGHNFVLQLDRRGRLEYKCYKIPVTDKFRAYIESSFSVKDGGTHSRNDISVLCRDICGAALSIGYLNENSKGERINYDYWSTRLDELRKILDKPTERFKLQGR